MRDGRAVGATTGANAFKANVGETVRIFFGVGGPNLTSSFHVIGAIFDRVYSEGSVTSEPETNVQTTHVSAGGATVVEFTPKLPGTYSIVDHSLGRMQKGAAGQIVVEGADHPEIFQSIQAGSGGSGGHETFGRQAALGSESPSAERLSTEWPRNAATETPRHAEVFGRVLRKPCRA